MRKKILIISLLILCLGISIAQAAEFRKPSKKFGAVNTSKDEVFKNLYTAGNMVTIASKIEKDLAVAGNVLSIDGEIGDDLFAAGGTVLVKNTVGGSCRVVGGNIIISGKIKEDLFIAGGNILISNTASVDGDIFVAGGNVSIDAPVAGSIRAWTGNLVINNTVGGQVKADVDELTLGDNAQIKGNLVYKAPKEATISERAKILGETKFEKIEAAKKIAPTHKPKNLWGLLTIFFLMKVLVSLAAGLVLVYLFRNMTEPVVKDSLTKFWRSIGFGFSALILMPVAGFILLLTVIGAGLTGIMALAYILTVILSAAISQIIIGSWLIKIIRRAEEYTVAWPAVVIGVIVGYLLILIPFVGWFISFVFFLIAMGALYRFIYLLLIVKKA